MITSFIITFNPQINTIIFYNNTILIKITQTIIYPTLTSYLNFILPKINHNILLNLFITYTNLNISLNNTLIKPISNLIKFK